MLRFSALREEVIRKVKSSLSSFAPSLRHRILKLAPGLRGWLIRRFDRLPPKGTDGKVQFLGSDWESHSQARQDVFVQSFSRFHDSHYYLELGARFPVESNNTYVLEKAGWRGLSVELDRSVQHLWEVRDASRLLLEDALALDYGEILRNLNRRGKFGYLQVDIEPPAQSLRALEMVLASGFEFATVTFEHDFYDGGTRERLKSRQLLEKLGYLLVLRDVEWGPGKEFEDWWIHPSCFPEGFGDIPVSKGWFSKEAIEFLKSFEVG